MGNLIGLNLAHKLPFDKRVFVIDVAQMCWTEMIFKVTSNHCVILNHMEKMWGVGWSCHCDINQRGCARWVLGFLGVVRKKSSATGRKNKEANPTCPNSVLLVVFCRVEPFIQYLSEIFSIKPCCGSVLGKQHCYLCSHSCRLKGSRAQLSCRNGKCLPFHIQGF